MVGVDDVDGVGDVVTVSRVGQLDPVPPSRRVVEAATDDLAIAVPAGPAGDGVHRLVLDQLFQDDGRGVPVDALEGQAQLLLNDLHEYGVWLQLQGGAQLAAGLVAARWRAEVLEPTLVRLRPHLAPGRDALQAYCDALEHKWILSERAGADVGLDAAVLDYVSLGAPAPESARVGGDGAEAMLAEDALVSAAVSAADEDASR